jgi:hypothetical protein
MGNEPQDVKLSEQEQKLVAKLLSDPTYFPLEFRTWLKNYIEGAGITVTASQISGSTGQRTGLPAGIFLFLGGNAAKPPDTVVTDGAAYSRTVYKGLFDAIGTGWGSGDGSTTFNAPDLRDRTLFGAGAAVGLGASDNHPFGSRGGWRHQHSVGQTPHAHGFHDPGHSHAPGDVQVDFWGGDPSGGPGQFAAGEDYKNLGRGRTEHVGTGIWIDAASANVTVGPAGTNTDGPSWAGALVVITTGKTA